MRPATYVRLLLTIGLLAAGALYTFPFAGRASGQNPETVRKQLDPKAWGGNHVGQPIPEYVHGDECLFCHRYDVGVTWQKNAHGTTVRQREDAPELTALLSAQPALAEAAPQVEYFLGGRHRLRFLRKEGYGKFAMLSAQAEVTAGSAKIIGGEKLAWDKEKFADRCAGCHATAVDPADKTFSAFGLDCYVCHGEVNLKHSTDTSLVWLSKKRRSDARVITSLCAQCHLRGSRSRSTGRPYPSNFITGDNLFQDLEVDWARADDDRLNVGDRHVWRNVREVALYGNEAITCLSCHQVHGSSSLKHRRVLRASICSECHEGEGFKNVKRYQVHSELCEY